MYGQKAGLEAAVAAAAKVDASLHAKGKLNKSVLEGLSKSDVLKLIQAEFSINHVSQAKRNLLCKGSTQEVVKDFSGACVSTKGRYLSDAQLSCLNPNDRTVKNLGLYLFIQGPTKRSVDLAVQKIEEMIAAPVENSPMRPAPQPQQTQHQQQGLQSGNSPTAPTAGAPPSLMSLAMQGPPPNMDRVGKFVDKIPVGMENVLPGFNLPMKLIGQGGSNLNYIKNETGVMVTLRGIGSAFLETATQMEAPEPLHFCIVANKPEVLTTARDLTLNLIATVQQEYAQFQVQQPPPQTAPASIHPVTMDPSLVIHQHQATTMNSIGGQEQQPTILHQPVMTTSIALPVVQTGFIQQPTVTQLTAPPPIVGVPPPQFSQPPPTQVALPPPGVHIPQQQGPLVPPPTQHIQIHQHGLDQTGGVLQSFPGQQPAQQQYVITQNGQSVQGIMTSQGLVVLNQQPQPTYTQQQVFLSQPPPMGHAPHVLQQGQIAFQQGHTGQPVHTTTMAPVSYQLQYVQQNPPPVVAYSHIQSQTQPSHLPQSSPFQMQPSGQPPPTTRPSSPRSTFIPVSAAAAVNRPPGEMVQSYDSYPPSSHYQQQVQHQVVVKVAPQPVQPMQFVPGYPPVTPHVGPYQVVPGTLGTLQDDNKPKRKFTEEAPAQDHQQVPGTMQVTTNGGANLLLPPQPVPAPVQQVQQRQGVGAPELVNVNQQARPGHGPSTEKETGEESAGVGPPPPGPPAPTGNAQFQPQDGGTQQEAAKLNSRPWFEENQSQRDLSQRDTRDRRRDDREEGNMCYTRRDRGDRPTYNHYSSKPQMYDNLVQYPLRGLGVCPPPPPPPPPLMPHQQPAPNYFYSNTRQY